MKKIIALACMITCIFGFTACNAEPEYTEYEQQKINNAELVAEILALPYIQYFADDAHVHDLDELTGEEVERKAADEIAEYSLAVTGTELEFKVDGYAFKNAVISFNSALDTVGTIVSLGEPESKIDGKTIVVTFPVTGSIKNGEAELIFSNDVFAVLQSATLNEKATMGDLMTKAALNTLIGMGTVFIVLILISLIIGAFGFIPKIQAWAANRGKKEETKIESIDNTIAQIVEKEEDVTDDLELVAVIAAAIAASEGQTSTDGFVVRSIRKVNRRR
jgi:sodium pump decarboxylase gamma subunit